MHSLELIRRGVFCFLACASAAVAYDCPFPKCNECLPGTVRQAPGVGVEVTDSYAAVSVHYYNGTISDLAVIEASPAHRALFRRLSLTLEPPASDWWSRQKRKLNRLLGRPSTPDIGTLATLLGSTHNLLATSFPEPLPKIALSLAAFPGLPWQDVHEAVTLAGLEQWGLGMPWPGFIPSPSAALAAGGVALCKEWRNPYACSDEVLDGDLPLLSVLSISLTDESLLTTISRVNEAFSDTLADLSVHSATPNLGLSHLPAGDHESTAKKKYWSSVRDHIAGFHRDTANRTRAITSLVLQGSGGALTELREAIKEALGLLMVKELERRSVPPPPLWAAARGAALHARRKQEAPENCEEPESCYSELQNSSDWWFERHGVLEQKFMDL